MMYGCIKLSLIQIIIRRQIVPLNLAQMIPTVDLFLSRTESRYQCRSLRTNQRWRSKWPSVSSNSIYPKDLSMSSSHTWRRLSDPLTTPFSFNLSLSYKSTLSTWLSRLLAIQSSDRFRFVVIKCLLILWRGCPLRDLSPKISAAKCCNLR